MHLDSNERKCWNNRKLERGRNGFCNRRKESRVDGEGVKGDYQDLPLQVNFCARVLYKEKGGMFLPKQCSFVATEVHVICFC